MESNIQVHDGEFFLIQIIPYQLESNIHVHDGEFFSIQITTY